MNIDPHHQPVLVPHLKGGFTGRYRILVMERGRVVQERPWSSNLILDQGLDQFALSAEFGNLSATCAVGTGTAPTFKDSGAITFTSAGTALTASAPFFAAGDVGALFKPDTGIEVYITGFTSTTIVTTSADPLAVASLGTVWYVNQVGLGTEVHRTNNYLTGAGNCGGTDVANKRTVRRTYDFPAEIANQVFTELGWSFSIAPGNNLYSRTLITGGSVSVLIGQQLRVIYDLSLTITPNASTASATTITGWPVAPATDQNGNYILNRGMDAFSSVSTLGVLTEFNANTMLLEPSVNRTFASSLCTGAVLPAFGANYTVGTNLGSSAGLTLGGYVAGTFTRTRSGVYSVGTVNSTIIRGVTMDGAGAPLITFIWGQAQTKDNLHSLTVTWTLAWQRILVNP